MRKLIKPGRITALVVLLVALGNALGALIIPAARLVYQPKEEQPHWE